ncbi:MAG: VWA domain-containing protein, partial [Planctomycetes bacterium]|nr:VWA domain-containing protein [Planctomycetota bacterium]
VFDRLRKVESSSLLALLAPRPGAARGGFLLTLSGDLFLHPAFLWVLLLAPLAGAALLRLEQRSRRKMARDLGPRHAKLARELSIGSRRGAHLLFAVGLLCALGAVLEPVWGEGEQEITRRGADIAVCLDVSRSMLARDVAPDRLTRAKDEIRALAARAEGDRIALVAFAGEARLLVPLTSDRESLGQLLDLAGPLSVTRGGTDLGAALRTALGALRHGTGEHEAILLLTDGDDHAGAGLAAAGECADRGIAVHVLGLGSPRGARIPMDSGGGEEFLRDRSGGEVLSALDVAGLSRIAEAAGGAFVAAESRARPLVELYESGIAPRADKVFEAERRSMRVNRYQWPLVAAFLLWILGLWLPDRKRR